MKKVLVFITAALMLISLLGCSKQIIKFDIDGAERITVFSGRGMKAETTDTEAIAHITENINSLSFVKGTSSEDQNGFAYAITWYDGDGNEIVAITVMSEDRISYEGYFYDAKSGSSVDIGHIEEFFYVTSE